MTAPESEYLDGVLAAALQSRKRREGPRGNTRWKPHFWVVNLEERKIYLYKNDQTLQPKAYISAGDIVNVAISSDKHNKFFHLLIKLRGGMVRELRMQSREQRDRWMATVLDLIRSEKNQDRTTSLMSVTGQQMVALSREFGIVVQTENDQIARLDEKDVPLYVSGLTVAADLLRQVVAILPAHLQTAAVTHVTVAVLFDPNAQYARETRYDPALKLLRIAIKCVRDPQSGAPSYQTVDAAAVLQIVSSTLWRNPELEAFAKPGSAGRMEADRIARLLQIETFDVSLEWTHHADSEEGALVVKRYIDKFVNAKLIADVHRVFQHVIHADAGQPDTTVIPRGSSASGEDNALIVTPPTAVACLGRYVKGVAILIDSDAIRALRMPSISARHEAWNSPEIGPALTITTHYRHRKKLQEDGAQKISPGQGQVGAASSEPAADHEDPLTALAAQLNDIILHVRIADCCRAFETMGTEHIGLIGGCSASWESLILSIVSCSPSLSEASLHVLIAAFIPVYAPRLRQLRAVLLAAQLLDPLRKAIRSWRVTFSNPHPDGRLAMPLVENHVFIDTVLLIGAHHTNITPALIPNIVSLNSTVRVGFTVPQLGPWFLGFCASEANLKPFPEPRSDVDDASEEEENIGEVVAQMRKSETRILTDHDVVTIVYDSQTNDRALMVSAEVIGAGVESMHNAFPSVVISRHDLARVMTLTLRKLVKLMTHFGGAAGQLTAASAHDCLSTYCEYEKSRRLIENALRDAEQCEARARTTSIKSESSLSSPPTAGVASASGHSATAATGGDVSYASIAWAVLVWLMPAEAVLAMQSRRDVLMVGLENTGKTLIVNQLRGRNHSWPDPSVGVSTTTCPFERWVFGVKELGGRPLIRSRFRYHIQICGPLHGVIAVVDGAQERLFPDAAHFLNEVLSHRALRGLPCLLLVNNFSAVVNASLDEVRTRLGFDKELGKRHVSRCDVTHPAQQSVIDPGLAEGLEWLGTALESV